MMDMLSVGRYLCLSVVFSLAYAAPQTPFQTCDPTCDLRIVETIPENLTYPDHTPVHMSTYAGWMRLLAAAEQSVDIASYYWTLRGQGKIKDVTDKQGWNVYNQLSGLFKRGVKLRVVQNTPNSVYPDLDTKDLAEDGLAMVQAINFTKLEGDGILHTKLWVVDGKHFYVGSANMDWRSLTQVKEIGLVGMNCECLAVDAQKLFDVYWYLSSPGAVIPDQWPSSYTTLFNMNNPASISINGSSAHTYWAYLNRVNCDSHFARVFMSVCVELDPGSYAVNYHYWNVYKMYWNVESAVNWYDYQSCRKNAIFGLSSPNSFCASKTTHDLDALLDVINTASEFVYIAVMDYFPAVIYEQPKYYWPLFDDALRSASYDRGVHVRVMGSYWDHTSEDMVHFLESLASNNDTGPDHGMVETGLFVVPPLTDRTIPFTRVNHNKYMVSDKAAYISTSNWSGDYFLFTGGVSCIINKTDTFHRGNHGDKETVDIREDLVNVFERDWFSDYNTPLKAKWQH